MPKFDSQRRKIVLAAAWASLALAAGATRAEGKHRYAAIVFDGFPIFDLRPVGAKAEALFPGKGAALTAAWRTRQFEYQWLHALSNSYVDFRTATDDALVFACRSMDIPLSDADRMTLVSMFDALGVWPDVAPAVAAIRRAGLKTAILSNMTARMLDSGLAEAGLSKAFDAVLSTDSIRSYKPSPASYRMALDTLRLQRQEILFVPFAGWDAAGAKTFGYPTFWVNRLGAPAEEFGNEPDGSGRNLADLLEFAGIPAN